MPIKIRIAGISQINRNIWQLVPHFHMIKIGWSGVGTDVFIFSVVSTPAYYSLDIEVKCELLYQLG